jgi:hypothetical protein
VVRQHAVGCQGGRSGSVWHAMGRNDAGRWFPVPHPGQFLQWSWVALRGVTALVAISFHHVDFTVTVVKNSGSGPDSQACPVHGPCLREVVAAAEPLRSHSNSFDHIGYC